MRRRRRSDQPIGPADSGRPGNASQPLVMAVILATVVAIAAVAFLVGHSVESPQQEAAKAAPPKPSVVTAPVLFQRPQASVVMRATLVDSQVVTIGVPSDLGANLPVVSAVVSSAGTALHAGSVIAAVAGRPVIALQGRVPAYSDMQFGSSGVDVAELQQDLIALGYGIGADSPGEYGAGTAIAVAALYRTDGFAPMQTTVIARMPTVSSNAAGSRDAHRARSKVVVHHYASVPRGEVVFLPSLPTHLIAVARLGATIGGSTALASVGTGLLRMAAITDTNTARLLAVGNSGSARSDITGAAFGIRLIGKASASTANGPRVRLVFAPTDSATAAAYVGQNLAIHVRTGSGSARQWVVPVSAVVTNAAGTSAVVVVHGSRQVTVPVTAGVAYAGSEVVVPRHGGLAVGDQVVVGAS